MLPKTSRLVPVIVLFCLGMVFGETLDRTHIHKLYNDGDFDQVVSLLNGFMARNKTYDRSDSVFIAKHLSVIYSANPDTREKGKYYMVRLLELVPSAELLDMYVSDEIEHIFDRVKAEYDLRLQSLGKSVPGSPSVASAGRPAPGPQPETPPDENKSSHTVYWVAGGAGAVVLGLTAFYLMRSNKQARDTVYVVP